jgi:hypothetical protein
MSDLSLVPAPRFLPAPSLTSDVERSLVELAEDRMISPARRAGYELRLVGATVLPQQETITQTQWGKWLFVSHLADPTAKEYKGKIPVPEDDVLPRLIELDRYGVRPQLLWLGHQLHEDYKEGDPLPQLVPPPRELREKDERLKLWLASAAELLFKGAALTLAAAAAAPMALAAGTVAGAGLDPIIFGGVKHPKLPVVEWCALAQWEWE